MIISGKQHIDVEDLK